RDSGRRAVQLLILGGTRFVGRHIADAALRDGWSVTLFNRGRHDPAAFPAAEYLVGDRDGGPDALRHGSAEPVVPTSGYVLRDDRAPGPDRRRARPDQPLHVLGHADRRGRRRARA